MSTTATVDTNVGWTFACTKQDNNKFRTTTDTNDEWGTATRATTTDGWDPPPRAPSPPLSAVGQPRTNDHASLHWTACYDDDCNTHHQMMDYNYYPQQSTGRRRRRRNYQMCDCPMPHPNELAEVIRERHLKPIKACADWHQGKRVCPECQFLVNMENHHLHCSTVVPHAPLANITPPQEDQ